MEQREAIGETHGKELKKVLFYIAYLPEHELAGRVFMELWMHGIEAERLPAKENVIQEGDGLLVVTDLPELAERYTKRGSAVLGYLHEKNREASFGGVRYLTEDFSGIDSVYCKMVYARAHGLPLTILETKRCIVREMQEKDLDRLYEIYKEPSITAYMEPLFEDRDEEKAYIRNYIERVYGFYGYGMWSVFDRESGLLIGRAGIEQKEELPEMGYMIAPEFQRKGYATEVCTEILSYAENVLGMQQVRAVVHRENTASIKLCEKLGFVPMKEDGKYQIYLCDLAKRY